MSTNPYNAAGPFYDTAELQTLIGITRQAVDKRVRAGKIIAAQLDGGGRLYPAWQFTPAAQVRPALLPTWQILRRHSDPWTAILWLCTNNPALGGQRATDWLTTDRDPEPVATAARADAERWTR